MNRCRVSALTWSSGASKRMNELINANLRGTFRQ